MSDPNTAQPDPDSTGDGLNLPPEASTPEMPPSTPPAATPPPTSPPGGYGANPGAYPPPPAGGYPPPPPSGGYPPPPGGYGQPQGAYQMGGPEPGSPSAQQPFNIGAAFSYAWNKFGTNAGTLIVLTLIIVGASVVTWLIAGTFTGLAMYGAAVGSTGGTFVAAMMAAVVGIAAMLVGTILSMSIYRAALDITHGRLVTVGSAFRMDNFGNFVGLQVLCVLASGVIGGVLGLVPGLGGLLSFLTSLAVSIVQVYASMILLDKGLGVIPALTACFDLMKANLGNALLAAILAGLVAAAGAIVVVGLLVTVPLATLVMAYTCRSLHNEQVV